MKKKFSVPTAARLSKMEVNERRRVFIQWCKTKRGHYDYYNTEDCPLARFARAVFRRKTGCVGCSDSIYNFGRNRFGKAKVTILILEEFATYSKLTKHNNFVELNRALAE